MKMKTGTASKYRMITGLVGLCLIMTYQNCGQNGFSSLSSSASQPVTSLNTGGVAGPQALEACQIVSPSIMQSRIKNLLGIAAGDVPVLDDNGNPTSMNRMASELSTLGVGNPSAGIADDFSCSTPKFKDQIEIMVDACTIGLKTAAVQSRLFPNGANDYTALYMAFVGRAPTSDESAVLANLTNGMGTSSAEPAACAAVASSLQALISI